VNLNNSSPTPEKPFNALRMNTMNIKPLELTEFQQTAQNKPLLKCVCCRDRQTSAGVIEARDWITAANMCGWRVVFTRGERMGTCCPSCVDDMKRVEAQQA